MKKIFFALFSGLASGFLALTLLAPAAAEAKQANNAAGASPVTSPVAPAAPAQPAAPAAASPAAAAVPASPDSVKVGGLTISHARASRSGSRIDIFMSIKNDGKGDETMGGAETPWEIGDIVLVTSKDGKETEAPFSAVLPAGKTVDFSKGEKWIRVKGVKNPPKDAAAFPITFYFRSSPIARLAISLKEGGNSSVLDWFEN